MTPIERAELESDIVRAVAGGVTDVMDGEWGDREWLHLFVDFEIAPEGGRSSSIAFALARRPGRAPEKAAFRLPQEAKLRLGELADAMGATPNGRWTVAQIRISRDGRYDFRYAYGAPWRLSGNLTDKRFETYLDDWLTSDEGAPYQPRERRWWQRMLGA